MQYTPEILAEHLGKKYNADADYIIETHRGAVIRLLEGKFKRIGEVPDFSLNEKGTMVVLECVKVDTPDPGAGKSSIEAPARPTLGQRSIATPVDQTPAPPAPVVHAETATMTPVGDSKPLPTETVEEPEAKTEPVKAKPKQAEPTVIHKPRKSTTATDRGGKPLGETKK